jgi:hypothetical protein
LAGDAAERADDGLGERLVAAALEAERQTGRDEITPEAVRRGLTRRLARAVAGFVVIILGLAMLPLPGPGWLTIILGLSLLPYSWAERTVRLIRRKVPGVPEDGRIPVHTWIIIGVLAAGAVAVSIVWGGNIGGWVSDGWHRLAR